jgi:hypothetical protein
MLRNPFDRVVSLYEYRKSRTKKNEQRKLFPVDEKGKIIKFES